MQINRIDASTNRISESGDGFVAVVPSARSPRSFSPSAIQTPSRRTDDATAAAPKVRRPDGVSTRGADGRTFRPDRGGPQLYQAATGLDRFDLTDVRELQGKRGRDMSSGYLTEVLSRLDGDGRITLMDAAREVRRDIDSSGPEHAETLERIKQFQEGKAA
jgi:hypothetical protein